MRSPKQPFAINRSHRAHNSPSRRPLMRHRSMLWLFAFTACLAAACNKEESKPLPNPKQPPAPAAQPASEASLRETRRVSRGHGGCNDCHTPMKFDPALGMPVPQMKRRFSGHPEGGPESDCDPGKGDQAVIGPDVHCLPAAVRVDLIENLSPDDATGTRTVEGGRSRARYAHGQAPRSGIWPSNLAADAVEQTSRVPEATTTSRRCSRI